MTERDPLWEEGMQSASGRPTLWAGLPASVEALSGDTWAADLGGMGVCWRRGEGGWKP